MTQYHICTGGCVRAVSVPGVIIMTMSDVNSDTDNMPTEILTLYVRNIVILIILKKYKAFKNQTCKESLHLFEVFPCGEIMMI